MIQDVKMDSIVDRISRGVKLLKFCSTATRSQSPKSRLQTQVPPYADNLRRPVCGSSFWTSKQVYETSCGRSMVSRCLRAVRRGQSVTSLSSWHTLLEHSRVHNPAPVFSRGCLLPRVGKTEVQWSQIRFNGSEPRVVGSSWMSFPV